MTCPLCGDDCRCAEPRAFVSGPEWIDPEAPDDSEDQFAASLDAFAPPPPRYNRIVMPEPTPPSEPQFAAAVHEQFALAPQPEPAPSPDPDRWRQEVANRLENYRAKRKRRTGAAASMELDFEAPQPPKELTPRQAEIARLREFAEHAFDTPPAAAYAAAVAEPVPLPDTVVRWDGTVEEPAPSVPDDFVLEVGGPALPDVWNVIQFPAPSEELTRRDELAEPVLQTPRILDAPELFEQAIPTPMAEISLESEEDEDAQLLDDIEIPLQVAPLPQRVFGGVADFLIVLAACAVFAVIVRKLAGDIPVSKSLLAVGLAVPCLFWVVYQYLFLVYAGRTPGMQFARVALVGFEGELVNQKTRRWRALAMALSSVSLGLGFIWSLVDEDTLCWHDRITRTYPIQVTGDR